MKRINNKGEKYKKTNGNRKVHFAMKYVHYLMCSVKYCDPTIKHQGSGSFM